MGIAPTGKQGTATGITISRIVAGKIVEETSDWDAPAILQQLGVVPPMGEGGEQSLQPTLPLTQARNRPKLVAVPPKC